MIRLHILSCICSILFLSVTGQTPTQVSPTPTTTSSIACQTNFDKNYGILSLCTPIPGVGDNVDDAPAIQAAFQAAITVPNNYRSWVILPENQTFTIRSPIIFSNCEYCGIILDGILKIAGTEEDWKGAEAIIMHDSVYEFTIEGNAPSIDASNLHFNQDTPNPPSLLYFKDSSEIFLGPLSLTNAPGTSIRIGGSNGGGEYDIRSLSIATQKGYGHPDACGVQLSNVRYVFFTDVDVQSEERMGNCFAIDGVPPGGVTLSNIVCNNTQTGVTIMPGSSGIYGINDTISVTEVSLNNLVVNADIATGFLNAGLPRVNVTDVTFNNVTVQGGDAVVFSNCWQLPGQVTEQPCEAHGGSVSQNYTDIWLENYQGKLGPPPQDQTGDVIIDVHIANWTQES